MTDIGVRNVVLSEEKSKFRQLHEISHYKGNLSPTINHAKCMFEGANPFLVRHLRGCFGLDSYEP